MPKNGWYIALALLIHLTTAHSPWAAPPEDGPASLYYARLDIKSVDGVVTDSRLLLIPSKTEFRAEDFTPCRIKGFSDSSTAQDPETEARRNAISSLLLGKGLKSMESKSSSTQGRPHDEIVVSYEGVLRYPLRFIRKGVVRGSGKYAVEMEIWFSPLAGPHKWAFLAWKRKISNQFKDIISIFK